MYGMLLRKMLLFAGLFLAGFLLTQFALPERERPPRAPLPEQVNLALRRTAHYLLAEAGDSTSRIAAVRQTAAHAWSIRLEQAFDYDRLPALLQASFEQHGIGPEYNVTVLRCIDAELQLGYNARDYVENNAAPCGGRDLEAGCYDIEVSFPALADPAQPPAYAAWAPALGGLLLVFLYAAWSTRRRRTPPAPAEPDAAESGWLPFGHSRVHLARQLLICGEKRHALTYREAKLLHLFAAHPNEVLERAHILQNVWADEGVLVSRSVDVFVSRLRKMLRDDPSVSIAAVHGLGYRLEVQ